MEYKVKDLRLGEQGKGQLKWAEEHMPVLMKIRRRFSEERPLDGLKISACLHVTKETGLLAKALKDGGATITLIASNPLSTQDDVASALANDGIRVFAWKGQSKEEYYNCIEIAVEARPDITMDDGADLVTALHSREHSSLRVMGGTEETTTGVVRLRAMEKRGVLRYPIIAVNDAETKWDFDNVYGTGQSTLDGIIRATNILIAGKTFVVAGYGHCGRGLANRARGMGARVIVTEVEPVKALKAVMDGFQVQSMEDAAATGDIFVTATGNKNVIRKEHFLKMKSGAIVANTGHFNVEININDLEEVAENKTRIKQFVDQYILKGGKKIYLLAEGRLVNLVAADGHPSEVMDMSFANQALSVEYLARNSKELEPRVYEVPRWIDQSVAQLKLESLGIAIDVMTDEQKEYIKTWLEGTL